MNRTDKTAVIENLKEKISATPYFYIADSSTLTVEEVNNFRGLCFASGIEMQVVKNTLAKKALESLDGDNYEQLYPALKGPTALLFTETANSPARSAPWS